MTRQMGRLVLFLLLLPGSFMAVEEKKSGNENKKPFTFRLPVDVIVVNATVLDSKGHPVTDLKQDDFKLYEDGKLQQIRTFALELYEPGQADMASDKGEPRPAAAASSQASRPRMVSLVADDATIASRDNYPVIAKTMTRFVEQDMGPNDQVGLLAGSGRVQFPFTNNKQTLLEEIPALFQKLNVNLTDKSECPPLMDLQAKRIMDQTVNMEQEVTKLLDGSGSDEFRVAMEDALICTDLISFVSDSNRRLMFMQAGFITRAAASRQYQESQYHVQSLLNTLRQHIRTLRHFDAVKTIILFSNGFLSESDSAVSYELQDIVNQALASGVVLNTVDIRGLYTPIIPASEKGFERNSSIQLRIRSEGQFAQDAPLSRLADETGGLFHHNNNDLYEGIRKAVHRNSAYYVLTYNAPQQRSDGRYHHIKVEVDQRGVELAYRKGYYAPREELTFVRQKKEDILEAIRMPNDMNEIPIALSYNFSQDDDSRYALSLSTHVDVHRMRFLDEDSRRRNLVHIVVVAFDETDHYVDGIERSIDFKLTDPGYAALLESGIINRVTFHMPLGRYKIKAIVREGTQGKMGSLTKAIEIP
jgi:VWFA-related protein